jgi:hypothetical protein
VHRAQWRVRRGVQVAVDVGSSEKISEAAADHDSEARLDIEQSRLAALEARLSNWNDCLFDEAAEAGTEAA